MIVDESLINGLEAAKRGLPLNTQMSKGDRCIKIIKRDRTYTRETLQRQFRSTFVCLLRLIDDDPQGAKELLKKMVDVMV